MVTGMCLSQLSIESAELIYLQIGFQLHTQEDNISVSNRGLEWTFSSSPMNRMSFSVSVDVEGL